jgi:2-polyprenyl-6-methoxyphenol hydroxylase-like FAD-dependent oxidoreductase
MADVVVVGAGVVGTATALLLAGEGHRVTVLDRDPHGPPATPEDAWAAWDRRGVTQFRMAHMLMAAGGAVLRTELPVVAERLRAHGGLTLNMVERMLPHVGGTPSPDDARFEILTGRRTTIEWAFATIAAETPGVEVRRGAVVEGLVAGTAVTADVPHVTGVRLVSGEVLRADLVIDAAGRRSPSARWLEALGGRAPEEETEDFGFFYTGRFFRSPDGTLPAMRTPALTALGSISILTLPSDAGTWSVTLYSAADDVPLRRFRDPVVFERVVRACPAHAHWLDGERISDVTSMSGGVDRLRRFVVDGRPVATGLLPVGDTWSCTNPSLGRGITFGLLQAVALRDAVRAHEDEPLRLALAHDALLRERVAPWHAATLGADRTRVAEMRAVAAGEEPTPDPARSLAAALTAAAWCDETSLRMYASVLGCVELPRMVFGREGAVDHVLSVVREHAPAPVPGPSRSELLDLVA